MLLELPHCSQTAQPPKTVGNNAFVLNLERALALLKQTPLFGHLHDTELQTAFCQAKTRRLLKGECLYSETETADSVYLLLEGEVQIFVSNGETKRYVLKQFNPGDLLGVDSFIGREARGNSCVAEGPCLLLEFSHTMLSALFCSKDGMPHCEQAFSCIACYLVSLVRDMTILTRNLSLLDVYGRLRILINQLLIEQDGMMVLSKPLKQQEIADQIGSSREMVARILKELVYGHYITIDNRRISVLKMLPENF